MLARSPKRHLLIAGTGRAGTSFLVRYLDAIGLDTHIARNATPQWSDAANAGLEDLPYGNDDAPRPYVLKSPWMSNCFEQILNDKSIEVDVVLIPVRDLRDAASSRVITEIQKIYERSDWMLSVEQTWSEWGLTEGGVVFSLDPVDQERIIAVQFARLIQKLVAADLPFVLLDFPRIIQDGPYLYRKIRPYLTGDITSERAAEAHRRAAKTDLVRVERERELVARGSVPRREAASVGFDPLSRLTKYAEDERGHAVDELTAVALAREIARRKNQLKEAVEAEHERASVNPAPQNVPVDPKPQRRSKPNLWRRLFGKVRVEPTGSREI